jgi:carboxyl-terminal processing protease
LAFSGNVRPWISALVLALVASYAGALEPDASPTASLQPLLTQARASEDAEQWARAAELYERALLRERDLPEARTHYLNCLHRAQQVRRYRDATYRRQVLTHSLGEALQTYADILGRLQASYVERERAEPRLLVQHGLDELRLALADRTFRRTYLSAVQPEAIRDFRAQIAGRWGNAAVRSVADAQALARKVGATAEQSLGLSPVLIVWEMAAGACSGLDEYTAYLTPGQLSELTTAWKGEAIGVGIEVTSEERGLVVSQVLPGSPAQTGGVRPGDRLVRIDGRLVAGLSSDVAAELLRGEAGTTLDLVLRSGDQPARAVRLQRQLVPVPSVSEPRFVDERSGIAYLQLLAFQETTVQELDLAIAKLQASGMRLLVLDLRGNAGGLFETAVQVVERFLSSGIIVSTHGQLRDYNVTYQAHGMSVLTVPLVVLVDGETASSAELVAGALKENQRGTLVGQTTFGKGSIQKVRKLPSGLGGLRVTVARFYSPAGQPYSGTGVTPDYPVRRLDSPVDLEHDGQVQAALDVARRLLMDR